MDGYLIGEIMEPNVLTAQPHHTIFEVAKLMADRKVGCLIILEKGSVIGIITEQDISRKVVSSGLNPRTTLAREIMSSRISSIHPKKRIHEAIDLMGTNEIKHLPVIENEKLVGIITSKDIVVLEPLLMEKLTMNGKSRRESLDDDLDININT